MSSTNRFGASKKAEDSLNELKLKMTMSAFKEKFAIKGTTSKKNQMLPIT